MTVPSLIFLLLASVAALIYNFLPWRWARSLLLLILNLGFLATFASSFVSILPYMGFLALGFIFVRYVPSARSLWLAAAAITIVVIVFCWLKQYEFFPKSILLPSPYVLVGLSYVFFRVLHMVIDAPNDLRIRNVPIVSYLNFVLNFTSLVSGPIQRFEDYDDSTKERPRITFPKLGIAIERITVGLFKVWVVAAVLSVVQKIFQYQLDAGTGLWMKVGAAAALTALYPLYLFFNFSGYTDFVIGVARLFGINLPENFNHPFRAASFIDYWNRWHMSLSNWLKTYIYTPLMTASMRQLNNPKFLPYAGACALFITFFLIGAWHGRTTKFLFFGLLNGAGVAINQAYRIIAAEQLGRKRYNQISTHPLYVFVGRGITFTWVAFTLLWFWSDWPQLSLTAKQLGWPGVVAAFGVLVLASCILLEVLQRFSGVVSKASISGTNIASSYYTRTVILTIMVVCIIVVQSAMNAAAPDIIYKDF